MKLHQAFGDMVTQLQPFARWSAAETFDEKRLAFATPVSTLMSSGEAAQRREAQRVRLCESLRAKSEDLMAEKVAEKAALGQELKKLSAETSVMVERQAAEVVACVGVVQQHLLLPADGQQRRPRARGHRQHRPRPAGADERVGLQLAGLR